MDLKKYKNKLRILLIETPSYKNEEYIKSRDDYNENIYKFHKVFTKLITKRNKDFEFKIKLIGFDSEIKKTYNKFNLNKIIKDIEKMPMGHLKNKTNLSLYADYNPKTTIHGLGFKNKEKALFTIEKIKDKDSKYQFNVINTMLHRAKNHPNITDDMKEAIKIFEKWIKKFKKNQSGGGFKFLNYNLIKKFLKLAEYYKISEIARGKKKAGTTDKGFLEIYKNIKKPDELKNIPVRKDNPNGANWFKTRENRLNAKLGQMKKMNLDFFHKDGKLKGFPTKMHTILIMWGYSPFESKIKKIEITDIKN